MYFNIMIIHLQFLYFFAQREIVKAKNGEFQQSRMSRTGNVENGKNDANEGAGQATNSYWFHRLYCIGQLLCCQLLFKTKTIQIVGL